jgi:hypothetical protein
MRPIRKNIANNRFELQSFKHKFSGRLNQPAQRLAKSSANSASPSPTRIAHRPPNLLPGGGHFDLADAER